ncbi:hypothetical protein ACFWB2_40490 [Streptomyces virginiae]|uniref:hypothetical protein n=1 Tax=Streptomyces TaxID=1883 RepID=UPI0006897ED6|nr:MULTISPECIES: hypothetical protein [Streptomyces]MCX4715644.1 hypothetical protein [Streptomyces virginiae]MCX5273389.1 hypothetical protein [Streptomyces virginiae]MYV77278.1 hypothetical protein [Streptomyces sp. SID1046]WSC79507.1 hypothetical protein OHA56_26070 [Streptomyces virginiae]
MGSPVSASQTARIVRLAARVRPEMWDAINPHGPVFATAVAAVRSPERSSEVALNPQPLPPREQLRLAVLQTVKGVAETAIGAHQGGRDAREILQAVGEDWCPPPPHPKIPWPKYWPGPWPPGEPYPIDLVDPGYATAGVQAVAGLAFQGYADGIADEKLSTFFGELADRLFGAALAAPG